MSQTGADVMCLQGKSCPTDRIFRIFVKALFRFGSKCSVRRTRATANVPSLNLLCHSVFINNDLQHNVI